MQKKKWRHTSKTKVKQDSWSAFFLSLCFHSVIAFFLVSSFSDFALKPVVVTRPISASLSFKTAHNTSVDVSVPLEGENQAKQNVITKPIKPLPRRANTVRPAAVVLHDMRDNHDVSFTHNVAGSSVEGGSKHGETVFANFRPSPLLINKDDVKIPYPEQARHMMIEGIVKMRLTVSESGHVIDAQVLSGPYYGLRTAALLVARKLFFLPATDEQGQARTAKVDHEVVFRLKQRS